MKKIIFIFFGCFFCFLLIEGILTIRNQIRFQERLSPFKVSFLYRPIHAKFFKEKAEREIRSKIPRNVWNGLYIEGEHEFYNRYEHKWNKIKINSYGFRGEEINEEKPSDVYRILVFGGGSTFAPEQSFENVYTEKLEDMLQESIKDKKIEVLNYGISSTGINYISKNFSDLIKKFNPDFVIINNIRSSWMYDENKALRFSPHKEDNIQKKLQDLNRFLSAHILSVQWLKEIRTDWIMLVNHGHYNEVFFEDTYFETIRDIYLFADKLDMHVAFVVEPTMIDLRKQRSLRNKKVDELIQMTSEIEMDYFDQLVYFEAMLVQSLKRLKNEKKSIIVIDPLGFFIAAQNGAPKRRLFYETTHLTSQGHFLLAKVIYNQILEQIKSDVQK